MKIEPLVSIIIPFYNRFDLLENTLLSVSKQDYNNYEVLLVDDCSESQLDINRVERLFDNYRVIYKCLEKNSGPGLARSKGRELASGKYVAYLDSDDLWEPRFLRSTVDIMEDDPEISMSFTNVLIKHKNKKTKRLKIQEGVYDFYDLIFKKKIYWATGAALWRSDVSLSSNWKPTRDHEDYVHDILSLQFNPKIYHVSETLCVVNKNAVLGIKRSNVEMLNSLNILLGSDMLFQTFNQYELSKDFVNFVLRRISRRNYRMQDVRLVLKTYRNLLRWSENYIGFSLNYIKCVLQKPYWIKRIQKLPQKLT
ncbi:MAG: glycosyltransferase family A protein [Aequorivita sp.]